MNQRIRTACRSLAIVWFGLTLAGCGGVHHHLHDVSAADRELPAIELRVGERAKVFTHRRGLIWGGYEPGLIAEHPAVVAIDYDAAGRATTAYLTGLATGETIVYHVNRLAYPDPEQAHDDLQPPGEQARQRHRFFVVRVVEK